MGLWDCGPVGSWRPSLLGLLALGWDISGAIWHIRVGDGSLLSFFFFLSFFSFRALWFGLGLSFDWSFPLRVLSFHDCIFVLHIFNKLMKNKKKTPINMPFISHAFEATILIRNNSVTSENITHSVYKICERPWKKVN